VVDNVGMLSYFDFDRKDREFLNPDGTTFSGKINNGDKVKIKYNTSLSVFTVTVYKKGTDQ